MATAFLERAGQHGFIDGLQQSGPEIAMDLNRGVDDGFGNVVEVALCTPWAPGFSAVSAPPRDPVSMPTARRATIIIPSPPSRLVRSRAYSFLGAEPRAVSRSLTLSAVSGAETR